MSEFLYSNSKIASTYPQTNKEETPMLSSQKDEICSSKENPQTNKEETPMLSSQKDEICSSKEDPQNFIPRDYTSSSQEADISPSKQAYFFPSPEAPEADTCSNEDIDIHTRRKLYTSGSKDTLPGGIKSDNEKLDRRKSSSKGLNKGYYIMLLVALATCLVSTALTIYVNVKCRLDGKTLQEATGTSERKFSHPVCVQCIKLIQDPFNHLQADPLIHKLVKRIDDGFQMCCAENADQMTAMVEAITREQVTTPIPGLDNNETGLKYVSVSAHKQLLAGDDREKNVTEPYYGNGSEHFVVKLNKDYNDPLTEHALGVTVMDTALEVRHSGVYYVYFSVNLAPRSHDCLSDSVEYWNQYVHRTRPNSPANSGVLLGTSHTSLSDCRNHQESAFAGATEFVHCCEILPQERDYSVVSSLGEEAGARKEQSPRQEGGTFALKKGDLIQVCINGLGLVQFRKESSYLGINLLSNAATEK